ncbi:unnamed protein product [Polarella glacialis]|uniref:Uncharacterized protein n=1 Tax=Polarella glacialis TaxID=89957 RepID=A0A813LPM5_POLGL|nr:unnamed protein product [Polarella glacialis]
MPSHSPSMTQRSLSSNMGLALFDCRMGSLHASISLWSPQLFPTPRAQPSSSQGLAPLPTDAENFFLPGCCLSPAVQAQALSRSALLLSSSSSPPARLLCGSQLTLGLPRQGCLCAALSRGGGSHRSCNTFNSCCRAQLRRCFRAFYAPAGDARAELECGEGPIKRRKAFFAEPLCEILGAAGSLKKAGPKLGSIPSEFPKLCELHDMALMGFSLVKAANCRYLHSILADCIGF